MFAVFFSMVWMVCRKTSMPTQLEEVYTIMDDHE